MEKKVHVKTGDTVVVISGDDKGTKGEVVEVSVEERKVIVSGANLVKKHVKPRKAGDPSGIIDAESAIYASKVQVVCPKCKKPTRIGHKIYADGKKDRICKKCGETI